MTQGEIGAGHGDEVVGRRSEWKKSDVFKAKSLFVALKELF